MNYSLCISPTCPNCIFVLESLNEMKISLKVKNIDKQEHSLCPSPIIPALYQGKTLIAYGKDIIKYFKS